MAGNITGVKDPELIRRMIKKFEGPKEGVKAEAAESQTTAPKEENLSEKPKVTTPSSSETKETGA